MKWKRDSFGGGNKRKNGSARSKSSGARKKGLSELQAAPSSNSLVPGPTPTTPSREQVGLGTIRLGTTRAESAPICTPTPRAKRQLISELLEPSDNEEEDLPVKASPSLRSIISNRHSSGKGFDKEVGKGDSFSSYTPEEKVAFACHLNSYLLGDRFLTHLLPLDPMGNDFFSKFQDGVLLCRLVCLAIPGAIPDSKINVPPGGDSLSLYKSNENLNAGLLAAEKAGLQVVNIGASDIMNGRPASILGLSWQLIRVHLLAQINLKHCPDLIHLMEDGEMKDEFFKLPVEEILLRWINHHLRWAGSERRISNFSEDLADGRVYVTLLKELNDSFVECDWPNEDEKRIQFRRACLVISGAEGLGLAPLIRARHITGRAHLYNIAFVAQLLNRRPRIHRERLHLPAALTMQSWYRMLKVMRVTSPSILERRISATRIARAWRRHSLQTRRYRAAMTLQARTRGAAARKTTAVLREKQRVRKAALMERERQARQRAAAERKLEEERAAKAKRERVKAEQAQRAAREEAERLEQAARADAEEAAAAEEMRAMALRELEEAAACRLQAWTRGRNARRRLEEARLAHDVRPEALMSSLSCASDPKEANYAGIAWSPRTSLASTVRFSVSEDSPASEGSIGGQAAVAGRSWFDNVFQGIRFGAHGSRHATRRDEAIAAITVQRWYRQTIKDRKLTKVALQEADKRRWAARTLHMAYAFRWRPELDRRLLDRSRMDDVAEHDLQKRRGSWFEMLLRDMSRGFTLAFDLSKRYKHRGLCEDESTTEEDGFGELPKSARRRRHRGVLEGDEDEPTDCCDARGHKVLASEISWKGSYVKSLLHGQRGASAAQEARARFLAKYGAEDPRWLKPDSPLTTSRVVAMTVTLAAVAAEMVVSHAAACNG